ncbi:MAG: hypothetical protein COA52_11170 [Hyphomicrobiales bacterium]|nr:MAG: hypothetical protein COA52_11170 [Hyphomicrobiales bacterium]
MPIREHPPQGSIVCVDYSTGFQKPEMVKTRLAIVLSPKMTSRPHLCTIVPLSLTAPSNPMPFNKLISIPFQLPQSWGQHERWIKGDMINAVGFHRINLLRLGKNKAGKRIYQYQALPDSLFKIVRQCALHGIGLSILTKHL